MPSLDAHSWAPALSATSGARSLAGCRDLKPLPRVRLTNPRCASPLASKGGRVEGCAARTHA
eukprot:4978444-Alexandrium_andersonii.AAC.1